MNEEKIVKEEGNRFMDEVQVFTQWTPNPNAFKFITSEFVINSGKASFNDLEKSEGIPLVKALLSLTGVRQVHLYENVVTVTQDGSVEWGDLAESVENAIKSFLPSHDPEIKLDQERKKRDLPPELKEIDEILDRTIRPGLQSDGGDVEVIELEGNILTIRYQGACGTCPSSLAGTLNAITSFLREEYDPDIEVVALPIDEMYY